MFEILFYFTLFFFGHKGRIFSSPFKQYLSPLTWYRVFGYAVYSRFAKSSSTMPNEQLPAHCAWYCWVALHTENKAQLLFTEMSDPQELSAANLGSQLACRWACVDFRDISSLGCKICAPKYRAQARIVDTKYTVASCLFLAWQPIRTRDSVLSTTNAGHRETLAGRIIRSGSTKL